MKQLDKWIIGSVLIISATFLFSFQQESAISLENNPKVIISVMGDVIYEVPLDGTLHEYKLASEFGYNEIVIDEFGVKLSVSDCPDHFCESIGVITKVGQSIICAPHFLVVEIIV